MQGSSRLSRWPLATCRLLREPGTRCALARRAVPAVGLILGSRGVFDIPDHDRCARSGYSVKQVMHVDRESSNFTHIARNRRVE